MNNTMTTTRMGVKVGITTDYQVVIILSDGESFAFDPNEATEFATAIVEMAIDARILRSGEAAETRQ